MRFNAKSNEKVDFLALETLSYWKKPFVEYGEFFVARDALVAMIEDSEQFVLRVLAEIEKRLPPKSQNRYQATR